VAGEGRYNRFSSFLNAVCLFSCRTSLGPALALTSDMIVLLGFGALCALTILWATAATFDLIVAKNTV